VKRWIIAALAVSAPAAAEGNRHGEPRLYKSDISPIVAYRELEARTGVVLLDVRRPNEFIAGHIAGAVSAPYPHLRGFTGKEPDYLAMPEADFLTEVTTRIPDKATPIMTICSHGWRSALAANVLTKAGYINVRSVWTGMIGYPLKDRDGKVVDVNANGIVDGVTLSADGKPQQDVGDRDGWTGFHQLPVTAEIDPGKISDKYRSLYGLK
jgi:rhodanese-related sulfurtransferase